MNCSEKGGAGRPADAPGLLTSSPKNDLSLSSGTRDVVQHCMICK